MTQENKIPSPELLSLIKAAAQSLLGFGELWNSIKKKGHDEGFTERELQDILRPLLKPQLNKDQIYYLFHKEDQIKRVQDNNRKFTKVVQKKEPEQTQEEALKEEKEFEEWEKDPEINRPIRVLEEDPKDLEISFLKEKVSELEEALKKTQQFQPATALESKPEQTYAVQLTDEEVFEYLRRRCKETGDIIDFGRVGSGALVQALAQYKNSFGVVELFGRVVKK